MKLDFFIQSGNLELVKDLAQSEDHEANHLHVSSSLGEAKIWKNLINPMKKHDGPDEYWQYFQEKEFFQDEDVICFLSSPVSTNRVEFVKSMLTLMYAATDCGSESYGDVSPYHFMNEQPTLRKLICEVVNNNHDIDLLTLFTRFITRGYRLVFYPSMAELSSRPTMEGFSDYVNMLERKKILISAVDAWAEEHKGESGYCIQEYDSNENCYKSMLEELIQITDRDLVSQELAKAFYARGLDEELYQHFVRTGALISFTEEEVLPPTKDEKNIAPKIQNVIDLLKKCICGYSFETNEIQTYLQEKESNKPFFQEAIEVVFGGDRPVEMSVYKKMSVLCNILNDSEISNSFSAVALKLHSRLFDEKMYSDIYLSWEHIDGKYITHKEVKELYQMTYDVDNE